MFRTQVYKALRHGTSEVAVKHMDCLVDDPQKLAQMRREIAIMKKISFDANIVQFYGACTDDTGAWLMMEYMEVCSVLCASHFCLHRKPPCDRLNPNMRHLPVLFSASKRC